MKDLQKGTRSLKSDWWEYLTIYKKTSERLGEGENPLRLKPFDFLYE